MKFSIVSKVKEVLSGSKPAFGMADYVYLAAMFVVASLIMGVGGLVLIGVKNSTTDTTVGTILTNGLSGLTTLSAQQGTIATIGAAAVLLGMILLAFGGFVFGGQGGKSSVR